MKYARIENNKVMEIIDVNPNGRFTDEIANQFVECSDDTKQNMTYNPETKEYIEFIAPIVIEEQRKIILIETTLFDIVEDMYEFCKTKGFNPKKEHADIMEERKQLKQGV